MVPYSLKIVFTYITFIQSSEALTSFHPSSSSPFNFTFLLLLFILFLTLCCAEYLLCALGVGRWLEEKALGGEEIKIRWEKRYKDVANTLHFRMKGQSSISYKGKYTITWRGAIAINASITRDWIETSCRASGFPNLPLKIESVSRSVVSDSLQPHGL